jgi:hypothetical protein
MDHLGSGADDSGTRRLHYRKISRLTGKFSPQGRAVPRPAPSLCPENGRRSPLCYNPHPRGNPILTNLSGIVTQLSKERDRLHQQLSGLNAALEAFAGVYRSTNGTKPRRKISAKGRARIAAAQKARWAKAKGIAEVPKKRTMSASARRKIAAAQRARWAKVKGAKRAA